MEPTTITFLVIVGVVAAFYLTIVRPGRHEQRRQEDTIRDLHVGDEVVTTSGFYATVTAIETPEEGPIQLTLRLGDGIEVRALTIAISKRVSSAAEVGNVETKEA